MDWNAMRRCWLRRWRFLRVAGDAGARKGAGGASCAAVGRSAHAVLAMGDRSCIKLLAAAGCKAAAAVMVMLAVSV
jgi:hypothetical protein